LERTERCTGCYGTGHAQAFDGRLLDLDAAAWPVFGLDEECGRSWPLGMRGVSSAAYHAHKAASSSELKAALKSYDHYRAARSGELDSGAARTLDIGTAAHLAILQPELAGELLALKLDGRTTAGKDQQAVNAAREAEGLEPLVLLSQADLDAVRRMADEVYRHPAARALLIGGGEAETSWVSQVDGMPVRVRPDFLRYDGGIVDLKTCADASHAAFARSAAHWQYPLQAALYADVLGALPCDAPEYSWVAVEKTAPYAVAVYTLSEATHRAGRIQYQAAMNTIRDALAKPQDWRGYSPDPQPLVLPRWA